MPQERIQRVVEQTQWPIVEVAEHIVDFFVTKQMVAVPVPHMRHATVEVIQPLLVELIRDRVADQVMHVMEELPIRRQRLPIDTRPTLPLFVLWLSCGCFLHVSASCVPRVCVRLCCLCVCHCLLHLLIACGVPCGLLCVAGSILFRHCWLFVWQCLNFMSRVFGPFDGPLLALSLFLLFLVCCHFLRICCFFCVCLVFCFCISRFAFLFLCFVWCFVLVLFSCFAVFRLTFVSLFLVACV